MPKKSSSKLFTKIAHELGLPVEAIFGALVLVVSLTGVFVLTQASQYTQEQRTRARSYQTVGCNESCLDSRYCNPNHFCYQGRCRLANNPESETCQSLDSDSILDASQDPTQKGYDPVDRENNQISAPSESETTTAQEQPAHPAEKMSSVLPITKDLQLPLILGLGLIGLLVIIGISSFFNSKKSITTQSSDFSNLEKSQGKKDRTE